MHETQITPPMQPSKLLAGIYVVPTPIGHLKDMTLRAIEVLKDVAIIYCEDTRVSRKLLDHYGIDCKVGIYHEHSREHERTAIIERAKSEAVALVSDAGTPLISDPGGKLISEARAQHVNVFPLPGASAVTTALSACGLDVRHFLFIGFLSTKKEQRKKQLRDNEEVDAAIVMFERASRLSSLLEDIEAVFPDRNIAVAREITKRYETFWQGHVSEARAHFLSPVKGELVVIIEKPVMVEKKTALGALELKLLKAALPSLGVKQSALLAADCFQISRNDAYQILQDLQKEDADE